MAIAATLCITPVAARADEDAARVAFNDALELIEQACKTPSLAERWTLYETAHSYMDQITEVYPGSDLANRMGREETVDGTRFAYVKRELLKTGKAVCEQDFSARCVLRVAFNTVQIAHPPHPGDIYLEITKAQAAVGDIAGAFATIEMASSADFTEAIPSIMAAMVRAADLDGALAKAKGIYRRRDRNLALVSIVWALAEEGDFANGRLVAAQIDDASTRARALATVAAASRRARATVATASPRTDESTAARASTDEFQKEAARIDVNRGPIRVVLDDAEVKIASGDFHGAEALLERAREMALELTDENSRDMVYGQIVTNRLKMGDIEGALVAWALMRGPHRSRSAPAEIVRTQAEAGDIEGLRRSLETAHKRENFLRWHVIPGLAETGRLAEAHAFASQIVESSYYRDKAMIEIAKGEAAVGDFDAAVKTAQSLQNVSYRADALREVAAEQFGRGRTSEAKALLLDAFRGMFDAGGVLRDVKIQIYMPVLEAFANIGKVLVAIETRG